MKYIANFRANNGSTISGDYEFTNKNTAIKEIREMAEGNRHADGECSWCVYLQENEKLTRVAAGGTSRRNVRYRFQ